MHANKGPHTTMIIDSNFKFNDSQAITVTAPSTNVLDLLNARDLGVGDNDLQVMVISDGLFASADGTATLNIQFQGAPDNGSGAPGTYTTYAETGALTITQLNSGGAGGAVFNVEVPARVVMGDTGQGTVLPRFYRMNYVEGVEAFTAGHITFAGIVLDAERPTQYPSGFTVAN
jgi:hypothetical protein